MAGELVEQAKTACRHKSPQHQTGIPHSNREPSGNKPTHYRRRKEEAEQAVSRSRAKIEWVTCGPEPYLGTCQRCGRHIEKPTLPVPIKEFIHYMKHSLELHRFCKEGIGMKTRRGNDKISTGV